MKKLSLGIQDYKYMIENNFIYVDKTKYLYSMIDLGKVYFLSRPRRFGKSLTMSTLRYLFLGEKELFQNTYLYDKWNWETFPVVSLSMGSVDTTEINALRKSIINNLEKIAQTYEVNINTSSPSQSLKSLVENLREKYGKRVVVLIDEYDRPILNHFSNSQMADVVRAHLRDFYVVLKDLDEHLRFLFITGLTKFTKTGIFSTLNHLDDLTTNADFSQMLGYTQEELEYYFTDYIDKGVEKLNVSREELLREIKNYYNGYSFDGENFVYNPFSILKFFREYRFKNYWIDTGQSSFLIEYAKKHEIIPEDIIGKSIKESDITTFEIEKSPPTPLLFQGGYLTFKERIGDTLYKLDYPNKEVRDSFSELLLLGSYQLEDTKYMDLRNTIKMGFIEKDFAKVFYQLKKTFSMIPYHLYLRKTKEDEFSEDKDQEQKKEEMYRKQESFYHAIILVLFHACGLDVIGEESTNLGRSDIVLKYKNDVYVIELKKTSATEALEQIKKKEYYKKYENQNVSLIGISIDEEKRNLKEYTIETL